MFNRFSLVLISALSLTNCADKSGSEVNNTSVNSKKVYSNLKETKHLLDLCLEANALPSKYCWVYLEVEADGKATLWQLPIKFQGDFPDQDPNLQRPTLAEFARSASRVSGRFESGVHTTTYGDARGRYEGQLVLVFGRTEKNFDYRTVETYRGPRLTITDSGYNGIMVDTVNFTLK